MGSPSLCLSFLPLQGGAGSLLRLEEAADFLHVGEKPSNCLRKEGVLLGSASTPCPLSAHLQQTRREGGLPRCRCLVENQKPGHFLSFSPSKLRWDALHLFEETSFQVCLQIPTSSFVSIWASTVYFCLITISQGPRQKNQAGSEDVQPRSCKQADFCLGVSIFSQESLLLLSLLPLKGLKNRWAGFVLMLNCGLFRHSLLNNP